jgi:hypothetical protein
VAIAAPAASGDAAPYYEPRELVTPLPSVEEITPAPSERKLDEDWQPR